MSDTCYNDRFGGIARLYGEAGAEALRAAHVCVVGVGGVGSWAVEALARSGVGALTLIDLDDIAESNTNRQLHTLSETLGRPKVAVMAERVVGINPECRCEVIDDFVSEQSLEAFLGRGYDYVIDAIDGVMHKAALIAHCKRNKIPLITTGGAGGLTDPTRIEIADLSRTHNDPLAAKVRSRLRQRYGFTTNPKRRFGIDCVFSPQQPLYPQGDGTVAHRKPDTSGVTLDCNFGYGSATVVTGSFGFAAAARVIDKLIEKAHRQHERER